MKKGHVYFVPVWYNPDSHDLLARPMILEPVLSLVLLIHNVIDFILDACGIDHEAGFPITLYSDGEK